MVEIIPPRAVVQQLKALFQRNGYVRRLNPKRRAAEPRAYKKGDEIRLIAQSAAELRLVRRLLRAAGFIRGRPFRKGTQWAQPVYGRTAVTQFLALIGEDEDA